MLGRPPSIDDLDLEVGNVERNGRGIVVNEVRIVCRIEPIVDAALEEPWPALPRRLA